MIRGSYFHEANCLLGNAKAGPEGCLGSQMSMPAPTPTPMPKPMQIPMLIPMPIMSVSILYL